MKTHFAVYLAYSKWEVLSSELCFDPSVPRYPSGIARVCMCATHFDALNVYANTMCAASQIIEASSEEELEAKIKQMRANFEDEAWLAEHIDPYC